MTPSSLVNVVTAQTVKKMEGHKGVKYVCFAFPGLNSYKSVSRKRRLNDKSVPNVILHNPSFADDSRMYQDLLEMERKLDWTMMRKRVEIQDALGRVPTVSRAFRVFFQTSIPVVEVEGILFRDGNGEFGDFSTWVILSFLTERRTILVLSASAYPRLPLFFRRQEH